MTSPIAFLSETRDELQKVIWPNQNEIVRLTITVILVSLIVGTFVGGLDLLFTKLTTLIVK